MNVVRLEDFKSTLQSLSVEEVTALLRQCRSMAGSRLTLALKAMMAKVDDALFELSEKDSDVQSNYFETMRDLRLKRDDVEKAFQNAFNAQFNDVARAHGFDNIGDETMALELSLIDEEELEESIAFKDMASKLEMLAGTELNGLKQRIAHLLGSDEVDNNDNPVSPEIICHAFQKACDSLDVSIRVRLVIYKLFDRYVISAVGGPLYHEINQFLIDQDVLPELPDSRSGGNEEAESDLFTELQRHIVGDGTLAANAVPGATQNFLQTLAGLQHGNTVQASAEAVSLDPAALANGLTNVIRSLQESGATAGMGQADSVTIDVVAMLFDYILDDKNLPDAMKALIGRLQIPILKMALSDKKFFNRRQHPARQLLNQLSFAALGWDESLGHEDRLYRQVQSVVERILNEYDDDAELFSELLTEFQEFLTREEKDAARQAEVASRLAQSQDRVAAAKEQVRNEVNDRITRAAVPAPVAQFLGTYWRALLLLTHIREGGGSMAWKRSVTFMENLIWSVTPKSEAEERSRLVRVLPSIIRVLHEGMEQVSMPAQARNHFLAQLAGYHASVVNENSEIATDLQSKGMVHDYLRDPNGSAPVPPSIDVSEAVTTKTLQRMIDTGELQPEEVVDSDAKDESVGSEVDIVDLQPQFFEQVKALKAGNWLELPGDDGESIRARLSWVSPLTGRHLFVNRKGHKAANLSEEALVAAFQCGQARLIEEEPALDRAVNQVVTGLRAQAC